MGRLRALVFAAIALQAGVAHCAQRVEFDSADGKLRLTGHWFAAKADGPRPAVIGLHGCDGLYNDKGQLSVGYRRRAGYFNAEAMHFLALDSFGSRGLGSICSIPNARRTVDDEMRRADVFAAMNWLAAQRWRTRAW